ncbi:T9SS type A sorting domain-containing protein [Aestuariivivens sediminis]|uniref:T9SS type A sorting domain-containing protein n=1 Tax=Aestuariivivens sediminis TaxID=2913557 RepID=UPI001F563DB6|nr:T9SS type A sorting domain-containing protein [Aestuariivivens sediminis]
MIQKITLLLFAVFALSISAQTVSIQGGSSYMTIQEAIDASSDNDVILISGTWTEAITVSNKSITLRGTDPNTDIIRAAASPASDGSGNRVVSLSASSTDPDPLPVLNITIENLGIKNGNDAGNGGGIFADKITGSLTLSNLIIEDNYASGNGGGIGLAGSIATITDCTIQNNLASTDGGAILAAPNNATGINSVIDIKQSLIDSNTGRNGGAIYINGNNNFGNDYLIDVNIENSTVSNNSATSASGGNGGGAIFSAARPWTSNTAVGNITLKLVHATIYNNSHEALNKSGLQFGSAALTNFSAYNSIIVSFGDDVATKALNFANTNTTDVVNCILGGLNAVPTLVDDVNKNNLKGRTANESGLDTASGLQSLGGNTQVYAILDKSGFGALTADDYCTAVTGISLPAVDQRGYTREGVVDAGAFELGATLSTADITLGDNEMRVYPNPAREWVNISSQNKINSVKIYSILGSLEKEVYNSNKFSISDLSSGMHVMVIKTDNQSLVKRLMVE